MIIGADVGGTFTDVVAVNGSSITTAKLPTSTPQSISVASAARVLSAGTTAEALIHGTTVATNALLERSGARTVLITDAGFEDVIEIGRQDRPSLYDPFVDRPDPLVARDDRLGVTGEDLPDLPDGVGAVAIALIDGHRDGDRERRLRAAVIDRAAGGVPVSLSSEVSPEFREFERTSTTVLNAYLTPVVVGYLADLEERLVAGRLVGSVSVMRSSGGLMSIDDAIALPAAVLLSGPAGGVVAAHVVGAQLGHTSIISFDMGGTSTDVCLVTEGEIDVSYERSIDGFACRLPSVGVHTVGAGGGSIAWVDGGGALRVGPRSAGANPGPACYGRGGHEPTVTDANVVLGRIDPAATLGGSVSVSYDDALAAVERLGDRLGRSAIDTALGICRIAEEVMAGAVRTVSVDQGADPTASRLVAFGGAGGLHANAVARSLGMMGVIVPRHAGVFSALGLLVAPPRSDRAASVRATNHHGFDDVVAAAGTLAASTAADVVAAGHRPVRTDLWLDVRYLGQAHEITVPWALGDGVEAVVSGFERLHLRRNGFARPGDDIEIVAVRGSSFGSPAIPRLSIEADERPNDPGPRRRPIVGANGLEVDAPVVTRRTLASGAVVEGPAIIEDEDATTFLDGGDTAVVAANGALEVSW